MKLPRLALVVVLCSLPVVSTAAFAQSFDPDHRSPGSDHLRMVGYMPEWMIYSGFYPKQLVTNGSAKQLTHILYAFANLPAPGSPGAGTCQLGDPWADYETPVSAEDSVEVALQSTSQFL